MERIFDRLYRSDSVLSTDYTLQLVDFLNPANDTFVVSYLELTGNPPCHETALVYDAVRLAMPYAKGVSVKAGFQPDARGSRRLGKSVG